MIITTFENDEDWLSARKGVITGTKPKDIVVLRGNGKKVGFYQLIADNLAIEEDENPMERGNRLEPEAIAMLSEITGIKFITTKTLMSREDNPKIAYSPDAYTDDLVISVEAKCLKSALHLQAIIENKIPKEYEYQSLQPFVVNDKLKLLFFVFYDPRIASQPFHIIEVRREDVEEEVEFLRAYEEKTLKEVQYWVEKLAW